VVSELQSKAQEDLDLPSHSPKKVSNREDTIYSEHGSEPKKKKQKKKKKKKK